MFALVDCNNFYASCERVFRPDLIGKPIVVLSNNDGCVISRSDEAKELGIPMAAPAFEYEEFFKQENVHVFSANFTLYGDMSQRVMSVLSEYTPDIEIYSIDEAFLKLEGFEHFNLQEYGESMRRKVTKWTGIPISIGIAPTKALAKVANRIARKYPDTTKHAYVIDSEEKRIKALKWLKIQDVWGIGRQQAKRLKAQGITTAYDFTLMDDAWVKQNLAVTGLRLKHDLQGIPTLDFETIQPKRSIAVTRSFEHDYKELVQVEERIASFTIACAEKLRKQHACCNTIMVFIRTNRHKKDLKQNNKSIAINLPYPTNSSLELAQFAAKALKQIFEPGFNYKKAGVIVTNLTPEKDMQLQFFENSNPKHIPLMQVMDELNNMIGQQKVKLASQDLKHTWKMKQERLSPNYTTKLSDIITIHA